MKKTVVISATLFVLNLTGCSSDFWFGKPTGYLYGSNGAVYYSDDTRKCAKYKINQDATVDCYTENYEYTGKLYPLSQQQIDVMQAQQQQYQQQRAQSNNLGIQHCYVTNAITGATSCYSY